MANSERAQEGFFIAPYAPDAERLGLGFQRFSDLSARWLEIAAQFLEANGEQFRASWGDTLQSIETRLTSANGVALCTFFVSGIPRTSHLLRTGKDPGAERDVTEMFIQSLQRTEQVHAVAMEGEPFGELRNDLHRPLEAVVVWWPDEKISEQLQGMTMELSKHFVAAWFRREAAAMN